MKLKEIFLVKLQAKLGGLPSVIAMAMLLLSISLVAACGRKGSPKPPEDFAPKAPSELAAKCELTAINLSWLAPQETAMGSRLDDLKYFVIYRSAVEADSSSSFREIGRVEVLPAKDKPESNAPRRFVFKDRGVTKGGKYDYQIVAANASGVEGAFESIIRVSFLGESSKVEIISSINQQNGMEPFKESGVK